MWEQLPNALQNPFAITKYYTDKHKQKQKGYRLYTSLKLANGSFVVVSAEVKSVGRDIEVNAINTIFGRDTLSEVHDELIYTSKTITPEQSSLLNENNLHQYPTEQELSDSKDSELSQKSKEDAEENKKPRLEKADSKTTEVSSTDALLRDALVDVMRKIGIEVITDNKEAQRVLEEENGRVKAMSFGERYDYKQYPNGRIEPNLSNKEVRIKKAVLNHGFSNFDEAKEWAKKNIVRTLNNNESGGKGNVRISGTAVNKYLSESAVAKSDSTDVHLAVLKVLPDVIKESIDVETTPDFEKDENGVRKPGNKINKDVLIHRCYGAVEIDGKIYRVKITLKEYKDAVRDNKAYSYEATKIELLAGTLVGENNSSNPGTNNSISIANLLKDIEMTYNPGVKVLEESRKRTDRLREQRVSQVEESERQYKKAQEVLDALYEAGVTGLHISRSITDFGVSTYIQGEYGLKFRISDHSATNTRRVLDEIGFDYSTPIDELVKIAQEKKDFYEKLEKRKEEEWAKYKAREKAAEEKWERIKDRFHGYVFKSTDRTYSNFETFSTKGEYPRLNILQKELGGGSYSYEWAEPTEYDKFGRPTNSYGKEKPSMAFIEAYDENTGEVSTTRFFRTANGEAYGFTVDGKIYLDPTIAGAETAIHEYTHLWATALKSANPKEWSNIVSLMKGTPLWDKVASEYPELTTDEELADEVLAHYSGKRGAERLRKEAESIANGKGSLLDKAGAISALERVKEALTRFWKATADLLHIHFTTAEEVADKVLADLLNGVNPNEVAKEYRRKQKQLERINETNPMLDDYHVGIRGLSDILTMREAIEEARQEAEEGDYETLSAYPDITNEMLEDALQSGKITVYSSKPIKDGNFVTPSRMQAEDYAGDGRVYSKTVSIDDVAWINTDEGQFVKNRKDKAEKAPLRFQLIGEQGAEENTSSEDLEEVNARDLPISERAKRIKELHPIEVKRNNFNKENLKNIYNNLPSVNKDGYDIEFYHSAFNKIYKEDGIFGQVIPSLDKILKESLFAYSEKDNLGGQKRPDGTIHKAHPNVQSFDNYVGKVRIEDKDYYLRFTVQQSEKNSSGTHSFMVTEVDLYEKTANGLSLPITTRARLTKDGIIDTKLQQFFKEAKLDETKDENLYREVTDKSELEWLNKQPTIKTYRAMQVVNKTLYSPMASGKKKFLGQGYGLNSWDVATEMVFNITDEIMEAVEKLNQSNEKGYVEVIPNKLRFTKSSKSGKAHLQFHLITDETDVWAAYNPYNHNSNSMLNDQFKAAYRRGNLVVVEAEVPIADLNSKYHAPYAKDSVGKTKWKSGNIASQFPKNMERIVYLSRYTKPVRILSNTEVAKWIADRLRKAEKLIGKPIVLYEASFHPEVKKILEAEGFEFIPVKQPKSNNSKILKGHPDYMDDAKIAELNKKMQENENWLQQGIRDSEEIEAKQSSSAIADSVMSLAERLHLDNVEIVTDASALSGKEAKAKGFYSKSTGKITIVVPNNTSAEDAVQTLLHEAVAHYGMGKIMVVLNVNKCLFIIVFLCDLLYFINSNTFLFTFLSISKQKYLNFEKI